MTLSSYRNQDAPQLRLPTPDAPHGVLLINLGTPDAASTPAVRRYLREFLSDPFVIQLPRGMGWFNPVLGSLIAHFRGPKSAKMYENIWTDEGSPLMVITQDQVKLLQEALTDSYRVYGAMRYGQPSVASVLKQIEADGIEDIIVVPMYPQYSGPTTGTALHMLYDALKRDNHRFNIVTRNAWYDDGSYVYAQAKLLERYARQHGLRPDNSVLIYSAHGLPVSYVEKGDPYPRHVQRTIDLVSKRLGWPADRMHLSYQSRFGPTKWLEPATDKLMVELADAGEKQIFVCPIAFTADCLETLEELDIGYRKLLESHRSELYLSPALNSSAEFISALKSLVLRGPRPVTCWSEKTKPLLHESPKPKVAPPDVSSLVMVGMTLTGRLGDGEGPTMLRCEADHFATIKRSQSQIPEALERICADNMAHEAFLWNTCHRFEFYGWPMPDAEFKGGCLVSHVQKCLFNGAVPENMLVNVLTGQDAWQHLVRTAAGLNSSLPGDRDIRDQLQQALTYAQRAGTAGPLTESLVREAMQAESRIRSETAWRKFDPSYCYAALSRLVDSTGVDLPSSRCLAVGGSSTSRSVLTSLIERFDVPAHTLELVYRGHSGGQIKLLRKAIGAGRRQRVNSYSEPAVLSAMANADVVFFGIDRDEPVLTAADLRGLRDFAERPLLVVDFNTFGSTKGLDKIDGVTVYDAADVDQLVTQFSDRMCATPAFREAVQEAESWIFENAPAWNEVPTRPHRCHHRGAELESKNRQEQLNVLAARWQKCVRCTEVEREQMSLAQVGSHVS